MNSYTLQLIARQRIEESARRAESARAAHEWRSVRPERPRVRWQVPAFFHLTAEEAR